MFTFADKFAPISPLAYFLFSKYHFKLLTYLGLKFTQISLIYIIK